MFAKMSFQLKVLILGVALTLIPMAAIYAVVYFQNRDMIDTAKAESVKLAYADLDHIAQGVYSMCVAQQELLENKVHSDLKVANYVLGVMGKVNYSDDEVAWEALNQLDHKVTRVKLPKMLVGKTWLGKNFNMAATSPVVDQVKNMVGGTCTIFQRMDEQGSMLRVCTNVEAKNGSRAISTYIPAIDPDGKPNPVVSVVLGGQTFVGRAYVVNAWYVTAYEPIYDADKKVTGMLYVGVKEESVASLREQIMNTRIAKTGRVFILDSMGKFILSDNAKHDGESAWNKQDVEGTYFIQEICEKATKLRLGETLEQRYLWAEGGKDEARTKILRITYFKPWDWIICVGSYEDEFLEVSDKLAAIGRKGSIVLGFVFSFFLLITVLLWLRATQTIIKPFRNIFRGLRSLSTQELNSTDKKLRMMTESLQQGAGELSSAAGQVSSAAQALALGSNEQAAAAEETASSSSEMTVTTQQNADNALEAKKLAEAARINADNGLQAMMRMSTAISEIQNSSTDTAKIMKVIDEIAFQTNLLALNAAVEAVHAGEAGKSFAVVAEEVRNLAQRSAKAAKDTATLIEQSVKSADNGVQISREVGETFQGITENSRKMNDLVVQIAASSNDQAGGIKQINIAIEQMGAVTQQNASNAEESAAAAEELSSQVEELNHVVRQLRVLLEGTDTRTKQRPDKRFAEEGLTLRGRPELTSHYKNSTSNASPAVESHLQEYDDKFPKKRGEKDGDDDLMLPEDMIPLDDDEEAMLSRY